MSSPDKDPVLSDYLDEWLDRRRPELRPTTLQNYSTTARAYVNPQLGSLRLSQLDRRRIERHYSDLLAHGGQKGAPLSPKTIKHAHTVLRGALDDAVLDGLLDANPAEHARTPSRALHAVEVDDGPAAWTRHETAHFLHCVDDHPWRALWHVAIKTGARRGELLGLRWKDIDLERAQITIRRALSVVGGTAHLLGTKSGQSRVLSIGGSVIDALERHSRVQKGHHRDAGSDWSNEWGLVFTTPIGKYIHPNAITTHFRELTQTLDLPVIRLHDLRHTNASLLLQAGVSIKVISDRLGHSEINLTMDTYAHLMPAMDQDAAATLEGSVFGNHR